MATNLFYSSTTFEQSWVGYRPGMEGTFPLNLKLLLRPPAPGLLPRRVASSRFLVFCRCPSVSLWKIFDPFFFFFSVLKFPSNMPSIKVFLKILDIVFKIWGVFFCYFPGFCPSFSLLHLLSWSLFSAFIGMLQLCLATTLLTF